MSKAQQQRSQFIMMFFAFSFGMILSNLLGQAKEPEQENLTDVLVVYRGIDKTIEDLPDSIAKEYQLITSELEERQRALLHTAALQWQVQEYAAKENITEKDAQSKLFGVESPSDEDVNTFYITQADKLNKPFHEVKDRIYEHLSYQQALQARRDKIAELVEKGDLALMID